MDDDWKNTNACYCTDENRIPVKKVAWSRRMKSFVTEKREDEKKAIKLICVFPEKSSDSDTIKNDIKNILSIELRHQMLCKE